MDVEIFPDPEPAEREALLVALDGSADREEPPAYRSAWRRAALEGEEQD